MAAILIVDDEPGMRRLLARCIDGLGHEILEAESADAALEVMARKAAAMVFCDIQMPGRDGLWLAAELRKRYGTTAIVLATSVSTVPPRISMQNGVLAYIVKPFSRQTVIDALQRALKWHEETVATGPRPEDTVDTLQEWLDSLE
jgi:DNA-binding NtrC family response regulator